MALSYLPNLGAALHTPCAPSARLVFSALHCPSIQAHPFIFPTPSLLQDPGSLLILFRRGLPKLQTKFSTSKAGAANGIV